MSYYLFDGCKLLWHMDRIHDYYRDGKRIYPLHIDIGVTKACDARCSYCYGIFQIMTGEIIPREPLINLFKSAPHLGVKSITITGDGEPNLNPAVFDAIKVGKENGLDIGYATNGIFLNEEKMEVLLKSCVWIRFNLSAVSKEGYKLIHGVDKWEKVKGNIQATVDLKKKIGSKCTLGLQMVLIPEALDEVIPESLFAIANGLDYFVIKQFSDPGCEEMSRFKLDWYDNPEIMKTLKLAEGLSNEHTKIVPKWNMIHSKGIRKYDKCIDCPLIFQISGSGKCYPCGFLFNNENYCYGDLNKQSLKEILDSEHYWDIIKYMRESFDVHKDCRGCCRHDAMNTFIWKFIHPPTHINFP